MEDSNQDPKPTVAPSGRPRGRPPGYKKPQPQVAVQVTPKAATTADYPLTRIIPTDDVEQAAYAAEIDRIRKMRKPFGSFTQKLALPPRVGYHRHWFNDVPGRVDEAKLGGWTHVLDDKGKPLRRVVGTGKDKGALYGYAMEIPLVFWEEDQAAKLAVARKQVEAVKSQPFKAKAGQATSQDKEKFYSPKEDVVDISTHTVRG